MAVNPTYAQAKAEIAEEAKKIILESHIGSQEARDTLLQLYPATLSHLALPIISEMPDNFVKKHVEVAKDLAASLCRTHVALMSTLSSLEIANLWQDVMSQFSSCFQGIGKLLTDNWYHHLLYGGGDFG